FHVDSRDVGISDKEQIARWAADYSEDGYFFCTRVRGLFPSAGSAQFIATDLVEAAMARDVPLPIPSPVTNCGRYANSSEIRPAHSCSRPSAADHSRLRHDRSAPLFVASP